MKLSTYSHGNSRHATSKAGVWSTAPSHELLLGWTDEAMVAGLKMRESNAVQHAVETYAPKLYRYAVYQLCDESAAEDLVSEVIARMLEKIDGYSYTGAPFQTWLFSIARNLVTDTYRRKGKMQTVSLDSISTAGDDDGCSSQVQLGQLDAQLEDLAGHDAVERLLALVTTEQRQVLTLRIIEGWEPCEIATLLGRSIDSVKSLQYRGLQLMKRHLEKEGSAGLEHIATRKESVQ